MSALNRNPAIGRRHAVVGLVVAWLAGCGGEGGEAPPLGQSAGAQGTPVMQSTGVTPSAPPQPVTAPTPVPPQPVTAPTPVTAPAEPALPAYPRESLSDADCPRLLATEDAALPPGDDHVDRIDRLLRQVDPGSAHRVFRLAPAQFLFWAGGSPLSMSNLAAAAHETVHELDFQLARCAAADGRIMEARYLFDGTIRSTGLPWGRTQAYRIVSQTLPERLKSAMRYRYYIEGDPGRSAFDVLLDELNAYTVDAQWSIRYVRSGAAPVVLGTSDGGPAGMVSFMVFLQAYLKAARLTYPSSYDAIRGDPGVTAHVQSLWQRAEALLDEAWPIATTVFDGRSGPLFVPRDYLDAAYSPDFLAELDAIGVTYRPRAAWVATYLR